MTQVDDELLSAHLDGELEAKEAIVVEALIKAEEPWRRRQEAFRSDSESLRGLPLPLLSPQTRDIVYRSVTESFAMGAERRRVPRFGRRWMLVAAFSVPCLLTLLYLQNPNRDSRLYLRGEELVLRAGRSGEKTRFSKLKSWTSPALWGTRQPSGASSISFQLDAGEELAQSIQARVSYDFGGDGKADRSEQYEAVSLDNGLGWERFSPRLLHAKGDFQNFTGGRVTVVLASHDEQKVSLELSGTPGELVIPYRKLRTQAPET